MANSITRQPQLDFSGSEPQIIDIKGFNPYYRTNFGSAFLADSLEIAKSLPDSTVNLVLTSPPYALHFKKEYGNKDKLEYNDWFIEFAKEFYRILPDDGSLVLNIGGSYNKGEPTKSLYLYKLLIRLVEEVGFSLAQEFYWYNPAKMPVPAEWVTVRRIRVKDSVEHVWWLSKTPFPKANNRNVLNPYSNDMIRLNNKKLSKSVRPSGHNINESFSKIDAGGSIPSNVFEEYVDNFMKFGNNAANDNYTKECKEAGIKIHPARFPEALPSFFIKFLTDPNDIVFDPFAGSNTTGAISERLQRRWIASENIESYLEGSKYRFV